MQLIPTTAMRFGVNNAYSPRENVDARVKYLKMLAGKVSRNLDLALAAYNAGEGAVDRAHGVPGISRDAELRTKGAGRLFTGRDRGVWMRHIRGRAGYTGKWMRTVRIIFTNE